MSAVKQLVSINEKDVSRFEDTEAGSAAVAARTANSEPVHAVRRRLPDERRAITHHFSVGGQEGYLTVGVYEDGSPGEIFVRMAKEGSTISGLMDSFATVVSLALQHGVPLDLLCGKFSHTRFEPSGWTGNPKIGYATSSDGLHLQMDGAEIPQERAGRTIRIPSGVHSCRPAAEWGRRG